MGGSNGMFEPGNVNVAAPYFIAGRSGVLTGLTAGQPVARLAQLGMLPGVPQAAPAVVVPTPIRVSQIRLKYLPATSPTAGVAFEVLKGTGTPATTGGNAHAPQRRKTSGYPAIATTETHLYVSDTGAISGGAFTALDATGALDWAAVGLADVSAAAAAWIPSDLCPVTLEAGEALEVRIVSNISGTGILLVAFDFLR